MPGRKKGRQKGAAGSKAQSARKWNEAMRDAREDLSWDRKERIGRGGDTAPPRLSASGFRSLATLLSQRVRADEIDAAAPPIVRSEGSAVRSAAAAQNDYFSADLTESRPRRTRNLVSLCISQIGRDFLAYRADDDAVAQAFVLLPPLCLARLSRSASARGTIANHNVGLLCSPGVSTLWLRGRFTDEGADALLPVLHATDTPKEGAHTPEGAFDLAEVYRDSDIGGGSGGDGSAEGAPPRLASAPTVSHCVGSSSSSSSRNATGGEGDEDWETACDRIEASLRGGVSLTSLDLSSPRITAGFVRRLVVRIPSLRRLGLRGSLGVVGGPDVVCDHVPHLAALRELDLSHCTWFCDITLRRLAKTLSLGFSSARTQHAEEDGPDTVNTLPADDGTSGWGAASAPATRNLALREIAGSETPGVRVLVPGGILAGGGATRPNVAGSPYRFRTFTVICARTAVTEKGARVAEAISPGLLVVLEDQPAAYCV